VLPFLVGAAPASLNRPRTDGPISIPLSKRSNHLNDDGFVDHEKLQASLHHTMAFVSLVLFYEKFVILTRLPILGDWTELLLRMKEIQVHPTPLH
jgi:hypothetical protein